MSDDAERGDDPPVHETSTLGLQLRRARPPTSGLQQVRAARLFGRRAAWADRELEVLRQIGGGSMGTVYEARYAGSPVALKALNQLSPQQIYGIKKEFRMLANIAHPNVVTAYHLFASDDVWYFTMELVEGLPLTEAWRLARGPEVGWDAERDTRLRSLFRQLVEGTVATHRAGLVHRDLKPANVLVSRAGRLVIVDFGLVSEGELGGIGQTVEHTVAGTPAYMAPEQARGAPASPASDWYAVGLMLFELLTEQSPQLRGRSVEAYRPSQHAEHVPADLDVLCARLTDPRPERRPSSDELAALVRGWGSADLTPQHGWLPSPPARPFVGREPELQTLREAQLAAARGRPTWLMIEGESGSGKSTLLREFAARLRASPQAVVLEGRCTEHELLPHRGLDALVDQLTRFLLQLAPEQALQLVPRHVGALTARFPVLSRVPCLRLARDAVAQQAEHARALEALGELLCRIADRRPLTLLIDDLHWADADSLRLLRDLVSAPEPLALMVVETHRRSAAGQVVDALTAELPAGMARSLVLDKLAAPEAQQLAQMVLSDGEHDDAALSERIAREAGGVPLYVAELAASARARELDELSPETLMREFMRSRLARLPGRARSAFDMLIVAGRPLPTRVLARAAELCDVHQPLATLRKARLTRLIDEPHGQATDVYHEHVREACLSLIDHARLCECRRRLARALADETDVEPAWLAELFASIGERARGASTLLELARQAERDGHYEEAASLLGRATEWLAPGADSAKLAELHRQHAKLLATAGHAEQAAHALSRAMRLYLQSDQLGRACRASLSFLSAGHGADARRVLERALERLSLAWPLGPSRPRVRLRRR